MLRNHFGKARHPPARKIYKVRMYGIKPAECTDNLRDADEQGEMQLEKISFVVPCFNEEETLELYYSCMEKTIDGSAVLSGLAVEYIFVDDGSRDQTLKKIKMLREKNLDVRYISFSRNFGKEPALLAGLRRATGDYVVTMDVDLQDSPDILEEMYLAVTEEGYDCVAARRVSRKGEGAIRSGLSKCFYKVINLLSDVEIVSGARDYRFMKRNMVDAVLEVQEYNRFSKGIFSWVGFRTKWISYENVKRSAGETKWPLTKLFKYAFDGIIAYSTKLLSIASGLGLLFCLVSFTSLIFIVVRAMLFGDPVTGWPSMMSVIILMGGLQLLCIGIMGAYLSRTYLETKHRPIYIIRETEEDSGKAS